MGLKEVSRRNFLVGSTLAAAEGAALYKFSGLRSLAIQAISEMSPPLGAAVNTDREITAVEKNTPTFIKPAKGEQLLPTTKSIVLNLTGQNYRTDQSMDVLTAFSPLGVRMNAEFGNNEGYVPDLIKDLSRIQDMTQLRRISWHCESDSWPIAAQVIPRISEKIRTDYIFLNATPNGLSDTKGLPKILGEALVASNYGPSPIFTGLTDVLQFGGTYALHGNPDAASAGFSNYQAQTEAQSRSITGDFVKFLRSYNANHAEKIKMAYLCLEDPWKDTLVNEIASIQDFRQQGLPLYVARVGGSQQSHDNPTKNTAAYNGAITHAIAVLG